MTQVLSTSGNVLENTGDSRTGDRTVVVVVGSSTQIVEAAEARTGKIFLTAGPPAAALMGFAAYLLAGASLRPVERLRLRLADISEHDIDARLRVPRTRDEVATLATTMNAVLDRLARALARERGSVADAGHELRTPLTTLKAELELAQQPGRSRQALASAVDAAAQDTDRLIRLAEDLLLLARADEGHAFLRPRPMAPHDVLAAAVRSASTENGSEKGTEAEDGSKTDNESGKNAQTTGAHDTDGGHEDGPGDTQPEGGSAEQ
ncbi:histidine kinase dimerization/phospho-acceptor domain-containing protein [Actinomadura verrucosospora]|uniref:histidine kinase n=1 Tax=Actinomadura verrucosospora TaxID=46165 RepID=A0A7D3VZD5_ACTVE|nr:histidine kinase dimerization/phospho-acceptor domain-containing protein [Actinomadura verrucosospora]QKG27260.1 hypothetical protein ACTIVE_8913 [Actinomadura verrucosospora]